MRGFMIAADRSGSGKTTVTRAVMLLLLKRGYHVCPFKCGPDYIDPMYHSVITGVPGHNLDTFFTDQETTRNIFARDLKDVDDDNRIAVVEGVMGLFDGVGGFRPQGSSYDLARTLQMPVILTLNARGAAATLLAVISGILSYDTDRLVRGIFLNQVSDSFAPVISEKIEEIFGIPVVGHFPVNTGIAVKSRHLGLVGPGDIDERKQEGVLCALGESRIDTDRILDLASMPDMEETHLKQSEKRTKIAVTRDEAFDFFYRENELCLYDMGAEIEYFSPVHDHGIPDDACGVIFTGGYPELYTKELSSDTQMSNSVIMACRKGMPMLAECGGFMYLHNSIDGAGPMGDLLNGDCYNTGRSVRFGYLSCYDKDHDFVKEGNMIKGHEFHYYDVADPGSDAVAVKPYTDMTRELGFSAPNMFLSFAHLYYPSYPYFAEHFVDEAEKYGRYRQV